MTGMKTPTGLLLGAAFAAGIVAGPATVCLKASPTRMGETMLSVMGKGTARKNA